MEGKEGTEERGSRGEGGAERHTRGGGERMRGEGEREEEANTHREGLSHGHRRHPFTKLLVNDLISPLSSVTFPLCASFENYLGYSGPFTFPLHFRICSPCSQSLVGITQNLLTGAECTGFPGSKEGVNKEVPSSWAVILLPPVPLQAWHLRYPHKGNSPERDPQSVYYFLCQKLLFPCKPTTLMR